MKLLTNIYRLLNTNAYIILASLTFIITTLTMIVDITLYKIYLPVFVFTIIVLTIFIVSKRRKLSNKELDKETNKILMTVLTREKEIDNVNKLNFFITQSEKTYSNDELIKMSKSEDMLTKVYVGLNLNTPNIILEEYSMSDIEQLQYAAASNLNTPKRVKDKLVWEQLTDVKSKSNQERLLNNKNTPSDILTKIYEEPYNADLVLEPLVKHPNTSDDLINTILQDKNPELFIAFMSNSNISSKVKSISTIKSFTYIEDLDNNLAELFFNNPNITYKALDLWGSDFGRGGIEKAVRDTYSNLSHNPESQSMNDEALVWVAKNIPTLKRIAINSIKAREASWNDFPDDYIISSLTPIN